MGTFALEFRFGAFALKLALKNFRLEALAWELSFGGTFACELGFRKKNVWELSLGNFGSGSLAWDLWLGIFGLGSWVRGTGILRLGEPLDGSWGNLARRGATTGLYDTE